MWGRRSDQQPVDRIQAVEGWPGAGQCYSADEDAPVIFGEGSERRQRERAMRAAGRLPPGQSLTLKWPVLHAGSVPRFDPARGISGRRAGREAGAAHLGRIRRLPQTEMSADIHCVTRWSRFDNRWGGVLFAEVMKLVQPKPGALCADASRSTATPPICRSRI